MRTRRPPRASGAGSCFGGSVRADSSRRPSSPPPRVDDARGDEERKRDESPVEHEPPEIHDSFRELVHLRQDRHVGAEIVQWSRLEDPLTDAEDQQAENDERGQHHRDELAPRHRAHERSHGEVTRADSDDTDVARKDDVPIDVARLSEDDGIEHRRRPYQSVRRQRGEVLRQNDRRRRHGRRQKRLDRAAPALFGEETHGERRAHEKERQHQKERLPEERLNGTLVDRNVGEAREVKEDLIEARALQEEEHDEEHPREWRDPERQHFPAIDREQTPHDRSSSFGAGASASVSSAKTSSSVACTGTASRTPTPPFTSCETIRSSSDPSRAASGENSTTRRATPSDRTSAFTRETSGNSSRSRGALPEPSVTTSVAPPVARRARRSAIVPSATSLPRSMTIARSQVASTSGRM